MIIKHIAGCTRICGKNQGYLGLPVRDEPVSVRVADDEVVSTNGMHTAWEPTPDELAKLVAGAPVVVCVLGTTPQPMMLSVGDVPAEEGGR